MALQTIEFRGIRFRQMGIEGMTAMQKIMSDKVDGKVQVFVFADIWRWMCSPGGLVQALTYLAVDPFDASNMDDVADWATWIDALESLVYWSSVKSKGDDKDDSGNGEDSGVSNGAN